MIYQCIGGIGGLVLGYTIEKNQPSNDAHEIGLRYIIAPMLLEVLLLQNMLGTGMDKEVGIGSVIGIAIGGIFACLLRKEP